MKAEACSAGESCILSCAKQQTLRSAGGCHHEANLCVINSQCKDEAKQSSENVIAHSCLLRVLLIDCGIPWHFKHFRHHLSFLTNSCLSALREASILPGYDLKNLEYKRVSAHID